MDSFFRWNFYESKILPKAGFPRKIKCVLFLAKFSLHVLYPKSCCFRQRFRPNGPISALSLHAFSDTFTHCRFREIGNELLINESQTFIMKVSILWGKPCLPPLHSTKMFQPCWMRSFFSYSEASVNLCFFTVCSTSLKFGPKLLPKPPENILSYEMNP